ncbi:DUF4412 domain-containing protein [Fulvivirga sp. M361]|uniref:DUF4412 domain-containing protein n=1 Tax=Fulvivirga sp. M361 TaxID=2594266 RepID=UPI00117B0D4C|nr:DUF4412 domain-containing protein [Fulvivirga sp. M361]TRX54795.1 DUF4412 domain-containing protein [Fulvivirga sp. M361]
MKHLTLLTFFICCSIIHAHSQDFEGTIQYEVSYMNLTKEMKDMLPEENPKSIFSIKGTKTKMEMDMMGTKMIILSDIETNTSTSYTDIMGQKIKSTTPMEDVEGVEIKLIDGATKRIAGYLCKKAIMKQPDSPDVEVYYSEDLKSSAFSSMQSQFKKLKGIPLEYQLNQQGITMTYSAKEVIRKPLNNSVFNPPEGDYKKAPEMPKY